MLNPISQRDKRDPPRQILECSNATGALVMAISYRRAELADILAVSGLRQASEAGGAATDRMLRYLTGEHHPQQALPPRGRWGAGGGWGPPSAAGATAARDVGGRERWVADLIRRRSSYPALRLRRRAAMDLGGPR